MKELPLPWQLPASQEAVFQLTCSVSGQAKIPFVKSAVNKCFL